MAVVKGPAMSIAASGNMGSICYSKWGELQIARDVWTGTVPNTSKQVVYQNMLSTLAGYWGSDLTERERASWRAEASNVTFSNRFGERVHYSGYTLFISRNMNLKRWGANWLRLPIKSTGKMVFDKVAMLYQSGGPHLFWRIYNYGVDGLPWPDLFEAWLAGPYDSPGRRAIEPEYRFMASIIYPPNLYKYHGILAGKYYWMRIRLGDLNGTVSPYQEEQVAT